MERFLSNHCPSSLHHFQATMALAHLLHNSQNHPFQLQPKIPGLIHRCSRKSTTSHATCPTGPHRDPRGTRHQISSTQHWPIWRHPPITHFLPLANTTTTAQQVLSPTPLSSFKPVSPLHQPPFSLSFLLPFPTTTSTHSELHHCRTLH